MSDQPHPGSGRRVWLVIAVLLAPPIVFPLLVNIYAREEPSIGGFPFFFWYQFMWIPIAAVLTWIAFQLISRHERHERERREHERRGGGV